MSTKPAPRARDLLTIPSPVRELFKLFPLATLDASPPPSSSLPRSVDRPELHVFIDEDRARDGRPSYNPTCLMWQTFLSISGVDFALVPSNNHASPSGSLPFLLEPGASKAQTDLYTYGVNHLSKLPSKPPPQPDPSSSLSAAYTSLVDTALRPAWLFNLYLLPGHSSLLQTLYISPATTSPPARALLRSQLRSAAEASIRQTTRRRTVSREDIFSDARGALEALDELLRESPTGWFFAGEQPWEFDCKVFSYTELLLDESLGWVDDELSGSVRSMERLTRHRQAMREYVGAMRGDDFEKVAK